MLRNILTLPVPGLAAEHARRVLEEVLARERLPRRDIAAWIMHAGGRKVLAELESRLALIGDDLRWSSTVLREFGNLSSPFVLFVLESALKARPPGGWCWISSFAARFTSHVPPFQLPC